MQVIKITLPYLLSKIKHITSGALFITKEKLTCLKILLLNLEIHLKGNHQKANI